jgi:hypothetical protein
MKRAARLELAKDIVQETVDRSVTMVETIHQAIAAVPFDVLETLGAPFAPAFRERQRRVLGLVYGAVRDVNRHVGDFLSDEFEALEDAQHMAGMLDGGASVSELAERRGGQGSR